MPRWEGLRDFGDGTVRLRPRAESAEAEEQRLGMD